MPRVNLIQVRLDAGANWEAVNPILAPGEPGYDKVSRTLKVGDGVTPWNALPIVNAGAITSVPAGGTLSYVGAVQPHVGTSRLYNDNGVSLTIEKVRVALGTAPTGSGVVIDVLKNGVTLFPVLKPTVTAGTQTAVAIPAAGNVWADGEYLTVSVLEVGTTTPGSDMTITLVC